MPEDNGKAMTAQDKFIQLISPCPIGHADVGQAYMYRLVQ